MGEGLAVDDRVGIVEDHGAALRRQLAREQALLLALELDLELLQLLLGVEPAHDREAVLAEERIQFVEIGCVEHADLSGERAAGGGAHFVPPETLACPDTAMSSVSFNWSARLPNTFAAQPLAGVDRLVAGRVLVVDARRDGLDHEVGRAVEEAGDRPSAHRARAVDRRRDDPVQRGDPAVVGPAGEHVAEVAHERTAGRRHVVPHAVAEHLQTGHVVGEQHGEDAVVGVRAHPHLALDRIGRVGAALVVDRARRDDGVLAPLDEPLLGQVERDRHRLEDRVGDLGDGAVVVAPRVAQMAGLGRPRVGCEERTVALVVLAVDALEVGLAADVERLEQVARALLAPAVRRDLPVPARCSRGWRRDPRPPPRASRARGGRRTRRTRRARRRTWPAGRRGR